MSILFFPVLRTLAISVEEFPSPPSLYSQAAVLMDADTGQVLYGKAERSQMYPASLTKIMTCLIAMEQGDPAAEIEVTADATDPVPRSTTHIALTPGEVLTLEQLEYAMMTESANDAANVIAVGLSGSIPMFAKIMNQEAQRIGARSTHFTNANGLPENDHYTTAYDLALITREAMTHPEFEKLAGTQRYTIPPTNMNGEQRVVNHRNYMFTGGDTYEGAFLGKTGWTEEAGTCLMTAARRNGRTLICVVLKASGAVDAEFKDSTALFDYGFDYFKPASLPGSEFPTQQVNYLDKDGLLQSGILRLPREDMPVLLPPGVTVEDLKINLSIPEDLSEASLCDLRLELWAPEVAGEVMGRIAGSFLLEVEPMAPAAALAEEKEPFNWRAFWKAAGYVAGALLLTGLFFLLVMHKRRKAMRRRSMNAQIAQPGLSSEDYYNITHDTFDIDAMRRREAPQTPVPVRRSAEEAASLLQRAQRPSAGDPAGRRGAAQAQKPAPSAGSDSKMREGRTSGQKLRRP